MFCFKKYLFTLYFKVLYMESKDYLKDLSEIKDLMNKSSRFISLSGLSGILAGIYALIGAAIAYWLVDNSSREYLILDGTIFKLVILDLALIALLSIVTGIYLTTKKAKKNGDKIWDSTSKRLSHQFFNSLNSGGIYILIILSQQKYGQTAALMLIFYGLGFNKCFKIQCWLYSPFRHYRNHFRVNLRIVPWLWLLALGSWLWGYAYCLWHLDVF